MADSIKIMKKPVFLPARLILAMYDHNKKMIENLLIKLKEGQKQMQIVSGKRTGEFSRKACQPY